MESLDLRCAGGGDSAPRVSPFSVYVPGAAFSARSRSARHFCLLFIYLFTCLRATAGDEQISTIDEHRTLRNQIYIIFPANTITFSLANEHL